MTGPTKHIRPNNTAKRTQDSHPFQTRRTSQIWHLSTIGFNNTKITMERLMGNKIIEATRRRVERTVGYTQWLQIQFGTRLIERAILMAMQEMESDDDQNRRPKHLPKRKRENDKNSMPKPKRLFSSQNGEHQFCKVVPIGYDEERKQVKFLAQCCCRSCLARVGVHYILKEGNTYKRPVFANGKNVK